jgi:hypothetical protein
MYYKKYMCAQVGNGVGSLAALSDINYHISQKTYFLKESTIL